MELAPADEEGGGGVTWTIEQINGQKPPLAHTPMYVWHKFWSRKTWNIVGDHVEAYCPPGGVVLDPFSGSGVTGIEAARRGRRAVLCDLMPIANEIVRTTVTRVNTTKMQESMRRVLDEVGTLIKPLFQTKCRSCGKSIQMKCAIWENGRYDAVRYECGFCGARAEQGVSPSREDKRIVRDIESAGVGGWYPKGRLYYSDGTPFLKKEKYEDIPSLFTTRNLQAMVWIIESIEKESNKTIKAILKNGFTSMVHLCTRMMPVGNPQPTNHYTYFSSPGWAEPSYWYAPRFMEQHPLLKLEGAFFGNQGLLKAKVESEEMLKDVELTTNLKRFLSGSGNLCLLTGDSREIMKRIPAGSIDYIFTDPPYDASIQYGELCYLWNSWLGCDGKYTDNIKDHELVRNERQDKTFNEYHTFLSDAFKKMNSALKSGGYTTVTFHNPTFKVRNATLRAGVYAGFDFEHIHHQPLAQKSGKSFLQPFGSATGDFYLRFHKALRPKAKPREITEEAFERVVVDTTVSVLAQRWEETPFTIIINQIDPALAREGFFSVLETGLNVETVLKRHLGKEFVLVPAELGGAKGEMWWFKDPSTVVSHPEIPLSDRVEEAVLRRLQREGTVTFTDMWEFIGMQFPNSLTTDSTSIKEALAVYARQGAAGRWIIKPFIKESERDHNRIISILAEVGEGLGHSLWVGKKEQGATLQNPPGHRDKLRAYVSADLRKVGVTGDLKIVEQIDLLWVAGKEIVAAFEVESTTSIISAVNRGSNIGADIPKYIVIPEERIPLLKRKMRSPLFADGYNSQNWRTLLFGDVLGRFAKSSKALPIDKIEVKDVSKLKKGAKKKKPPDPTLFSTV
ncbi:MAG: site-specific DNA-methyltransferase [Actinobacteria bacterium]|nr:site-specific DNA-methyltransferase [Actinomycetota bacterium]